jgi:zinc protease
MTAATTTEGRSRAATVQKVATTSGIEAWLVEDYTVPLVAIEFGFAGGASQDPAGKPGVVNLLAALLDEGAGPYDSDSFHRLLEEYAIQISFGTERDSLIGRMQTLTRHVDKAFELLRLAVNEARLDEEPYQRVLNQISAGLKHELNDPDSAATRRFRKLSYPDHPYGAPVHGALETLGELKRPDLFDMRARILARKGLKVAAVGAIDAAQLARHLDDVFAPLPAKAELVTVPNVVFAGTGTREIIDLDIPQSTIRFGRRGIARTDPDYIPAVVVNHVLGGGVFSARLYREVREKRGLAYSVYSRILDFDHSAMLVGSTSTKNERAAESMSVIEAEIQDIATNGPTEEELEKAKKYLTGSYDLQLDTSTKIAYQLVHLQLDGYGVEYLDERNRLIEAVTMERAKRAAKRLFGDLQLLVVVAGRPVGM